MDTLFKPIPLLFNTHTSAMTTPIPMVNTQSDKCLAVAGSDINLDAQVYLLYEMPTSLLARRFNFNKNDNVYKIMVIYF